MSENKEKYKDGADLFIEDLHLESLDSKEKVIKLAQAISNIPWGEGRTVEEVLLKGVGTCTGKHKLLHRDSKNSNPLR